MTAVLRRTQRIRPLALATLVWGATVHASAMPPVSDTARRSVAIARQSAQAWNSDAKLIYLSNGSALSDKGEIVCDAKRPQTGWMFQFLSSGTGKSLVVYVCRGKTEIAEIPKDKTRLSRLDTVADDFIDTDVVRQTLDRTSRDWGLPPAGVSLTLRNPASQAWAESPKGRTIWKAYLSWNEKSFATVLIDAETGAILKKKAPADARRE